jgi:hypothetical protein
MEVKRDRMVFVGRQDDPIGGNLSDFLRLANGKLGAPSGIYRTVLENRSIRHVAVDDQRQLAHMVADGDLRFGLMIGGSIPGETRTAALAIYDKVQAFDDAGAGILAAALVAVSVAAIIAVQALGSRLARHDR